MTDGKHDPFDLHTALDSDPPVLTVEGYVAAEAGLAMLAVVDQLLESGRRKIILDFSKCSLINSPGVVAVLQITLKVVEDFQGDIVLVGLNDLQNTVMEMAGVLPVASQAADLDEARAILAKA